MRSDLVESTNWDKGCRVNVGYNRGLVTVRHLASHNAATTTASLLLAMSPHFTHTQPTGQFENAACALMSETVDGKAMKGWSKEKGGEEEGDVSLHVFRKHIISLASVI
jgi:hypothetical protein